MTGSLAGQPTREFYQFILSLLGLAGGSADLVLQDLENYVLTSRQLSTTAQDNAIAMQASLVMSPIVARASEIDALRRRVADLEARLG